MKILYCDKSHANLWDSFLQKNEAASFYHLFGWREINENCFGHKTFYLASVEKDIVTGVFPLVYINSRLFGKILCSMPFVNFGGPCALNSDIESKLLQEAVSIADKYCVDYMEIRGFRIIDSSLPTAEHKVSMTLILDPDPETLWNAFKTKHRTNIRHAYKQDLHVKSGSLDLLDSFYEIMSDSWRNLGTPLYSKRYFENIITVFPNAIRIFVAYHKNIPVGAAFNGYYKDTVEGMWAGTRSAYRELQPNYVLYWEMIKHACEKGFKKYHLGRSTSESGGESFKRKWNAFPTQLYWQYYLRGQKHVPQLNPENPHYQLAIQLWKKLPRKLTDLIGPYLAVNIP